MTGHTKGPWEAVRRMDEEGVLYWLVQTVAQSGGWELAEVRMDVPDAEGNARVMAAAGDLLEALEVMAADSRWTSGETVLNQARAAIARARGEA